ncbi:MAG: ABC transporter ATP-binding protein [Chloroflexi bacterium]|nr:ABC transporter ATP-binding protein [Chloroflexota bacterium]
MDGSLHLRDLTRLYGKVRALDGLSLDIPQGSFVTLLGPSGCGKSTTLSILAGLDRPDGGTVHMGDQDITRTPPNERRMAMVFQNYALYPHMDAFDNIAFSLRLAKRPRTEVESRVRAVAEMLDIGHLLRRKPGQLSGGQQQRVALGRALVKQPLVFLLDEPFSNLDAALRARMRTEVKHLHLRLGTTSVFVTHDQEEALSLSDHIAVMRDGRLIQFGSQSEIYRRPRDTYVATFVGKPRMSLTEGALDVAGEAVAFVAEGIQLPLGTTAGLRLAAPPPPRVTLGVRAEDLVVRTEAAGEGTVPAVVRLTEPIGSDTFLELGIGAATFVARVPPDLDVALGQTVGVRIAPGRAHLFDTPSGQRLEQLADG